MTMKVAPNSQIPKATPRLAVARWLQVLLLAGFLLPSAWADYGTMSGESLVAKGQGITATSRCHRSGKILHLGNQQG